MTIRDPSPLAAYLLEAMAQENMTALELEERSGLSRATIGRILRDEVDEVKASQLNKLAVAIKRPFWRLLYLALGLDDLPPYAPGEEAQAIAAVVEADEGLRAIVQDLSQFGPADRRAVLAYIALLRQQSVPPAAPEAG